MLSFAFGMLLPLTPLSLAFGLLSTCFCVLSSAVPSVSLESAPFALASARTALFIVDSAVISTDEPWTLRDTFAVVLQPSPMLIATSAPIAVSPAASALAVVFERSASCFA